MGTGKQSSRLPAKKGPYLSNGQKERHFVSLSGGGGGGSEPHRGTDNWGEHWGKKRGL